MADAPTVSCGEPGCARAAVGIWAWKAIDMTIGVAYCEEHSEVIKAKVEKSGRLAGGTTLQDLRN